MVETFEARLVGLGRPRSVTMRGLDFDKEIFWGTVDMTADRFDAMWEYCADNWEEIKIAFGECNGFDSDGIPKNAKVKGFRVAENHEIKW